MSAWLPRVEVRDGRIVWSHTGAPLSATHPLPATPPATNDVAAAASRPAATTAHVPVRPWWLPSPSVTRVPPKPSAPVARPPEDAPPTGDVLRARREALGLSERELAVVVGCSRSILHDLEVGRRQAASTARKVLATLNRLQTGQQEPSA